MVLQRIKFTVNVYLADIVLYINDRHIVDAPAEYNRLNVSFKCLLKT